MIECPAGCSYSHRAASIMCLHLLYAHRWTRAWVSEWHRKHVSKIMDSEAS